jgi:hypothetical protein
MNLYGWGWLFLFNPSFDDDQKHHYYHVSSIAGGEINKSTYTLILRATPCKDVSLSASFFARSKACLRSSALLFSTSS